jgi:hypothetical protein
VDHVLTQLGGRTAAQAIEAGVEPRDVWRALCADFGVRASSGNDTPRATLAIEHMFVSVGDVRQVLSLKFLSEALSNVAANRPTLVSRTPQNGDTMAQQAPDPREGSRTRDRAD